MFLLLLSLMLRLVWHALVSLRLKIEMKRVTADDNESKQGHRFVQRSGLEQNRKMMEAVFVVCLLWSQKRLPRSALSACRSRTREAINRAHVFTAFSSFWLACSDRFRLAFGSTQQLKRFNIYN